jgi:hypothetical protein
MGRSEGRGSGGDASLAARRAAWNALWRVLLAPPTKRTPVLDMELGHGGSPSCPHAPAQDPTR